MRRENRFMESLKKKILLLDGAMGTMLLRAGLSPGQAPEVFNLMAPEKIREVHQGYLAAGANILQANTFGGNRLKLAAHGMADRVREVNQNAVGIAKSVAGDKALVAASMGPTGVFLEPFGDLTFDEGYEIFKEQALFVAEAGADLISIETMSDIYEIKACLLAVRDATGLPVIAHMTFGENLRTLGGTKPDAAAAILAAAGADVVGANCSLGPEELLKVLEDMTRVSSTPISIEPNAGMPCVIDGETHYPVGAGEMAHHAIILAQTGANIIGGCCGTTPQHIKEMAKALEGLRPLPVKSDNTLLLAGWRTVTLLSESNDAVAVSEVIDMSADELESLALEQKELGAELLHLKIPLGIDPKSDLYNLQRILDMPLLLDVAEPDHIEPILKTIMGKASVRLPEASSTALEKLSPLIKRFGVGLVIPTEDNLGPAHNLDVAMNMVKDIAKKAMALGVPKEEILIDVKVDSGDLKVFDDLESLELSRILWEELGLRKLELI